jgi:hypothetical protein
VNGNCRLYFENDQLCVTNGDMTLYLDLSRDIYETYLPDETITSLPSINSGIINYQDETLVSCLNKILGRILNNTQRLDNWTNINGDLVVTNDIIFKNNDINGITTLNDYDGDYNLLTAETYATEMLSLTNTWSTEQSEISSLIITSKSDLTTAIEDLEAYINGRLLTLESVDNNLQTAINELEAYQTNLSTGITIENGTLKILHDMNMLSSTGSRKTINRAKADENSDQLS